MKRVFLGMFLAVSLCGFVGCAASDDEDEESLREMCQIEPSLPECQDLPEVDNPGIPGVDDDGE